MSLTGAISPLFSERKATFQRLVVCYSVAFGLLLVVFLAPHAGYFEGKSFVAVARESPWARWGDWPAAWCSLKIILLAFSGFLLVVSIRICSILFGRKGLARASLVLATLPAVALAAGLYYLVKALF